MSTTTEKKPITAATPPPVPVTEGAAPSNVVSMASLLEAQGQGIGNLNAGDLAIPFLSILQDMSPQVKPRDGKYIQGAEAGMALNTVTGEIYSIREGATGFKPLYVIPCGYKKAYVEWKPNRGGFVAAHENESILATTSKGGKNGKENVLPNNNVIVETAYHSVFVIAEGKKAYPAIMAMSISQLKKSRKWNSIISNIQMDGPNGSKFTPPSFAHRYRVSTVVEQFAENSAFGWRIELDGPVKDADIFGQSLQLALTVAKAPLALMGGNPNQVEAEHTDY